MPKARYKKRPDGRYIKQIIIGIKSGGGYAMKSIYGRTIEELERKVDAFKQAQKNGVTSSSGERTTLGQWALKYCDLYKPGNSAAKALAERHVLPWAYAKRDIRKVPLQELQEYLNAKGKTRTATMLRNFFVDMYEKAVDYGLVSQNIAKKLAPVGYKAAPTRTLTELEERAILAAKFTPQERAFVYAGLFGGLRRGEILALTKSGNGCALDLENGLVTVRQNLVFSENKGAIKDSPKTDSSRRTNPLISPLKNAFKACAEIENGTPFLLVTSRGELFSKSAYRRFWEGIVKKMNAAVATKENPAPIQGLRSHMLRHTFCTYLAAAGIHAATAQKLMGHSTAQITLDIYTHLPLVNRYSSSPIFDFYKEFLPKTVD